MKNSIRALLLASALCMGAFFMPVTVQAGVAEDTAPPVVRAELKDGKINIEATDEGEGIEAVYINGKQVVYSADSREVLLNDYVTAQDSLIRVYARDYAGNWSGTVEINNPLYREKEGASASSSVDREQAAAETVKEERPLTPDGQASVLDNATQEEEKEFYTFETPAGNIFYLVVDKQRDSDNVYFLDSVTEDDLKALAEPAGENTQESAVMEDPVCTCQDQCRIGRIDTACAVCLTDMGACMGQEEILESEEIREEQPEKEENSSSGLLFILIGVCAVGGAGYYLKIYKPRHDLDDAEDLDDLLAGEDEEEINEDPEQEERDGEEQGWEQEERDSGEQEWEQEPDLAAYDDYPEKEGETDV